MSVVFPPFLFCTKFQDEKRHVPILRNHTAVGLQLYGAIPNDNMIPHTRAVSGGEWQKGFEVPFNVTSKDDHHTRLVSVWRGLLTHIKDPTICPSWSIDQIIRQCTKDTYESG